MVSIAQQPIQKVETTLASQLRCPPDSPSVVATTVAEHIRASLYGALLADRAQTIHTTRLLTNARRALLLAWPRPFDARCALEPVAASDEFCTGILRNMADLGDAWEAGGGQWLPTPSRLVLPDVPDQGLVLGTAPLALVEQSLKARVSSAGPSRFVDLHSVKDLGASLTIDEWVGPMPALDEWTAQLIAMNEGRMEKVGGLAVDQLELYAPDVLRSQRRNGRWIAAGEVGRALTDLRVCRPRPQYAPRYDRPYYLAQFAFKDGGLSLQRQALLPRDATLRLRFGLDIRLGTPRQLTIAQSKQTFTIDRPLMLPSPESRALALGWPDRSPETASGRLTFHNYALPFVLHALRRLSITPAIVWRFPA